MPKKRLARKILPNAAALVILAGLWWLLTDGDRASWIIGLPVVAATAWSIRHEEAPRWGPISVVGLLLFVPLFLRETLRGGGDVAVRVMSPRMPISPGFAKFRMRLNRNDARIFLTNCVSLVPGTLAANLCGSELFIHVIDHTSDTEADLRRLENAVARIFPDTGKT